MNTRLQYINCLYTNADSLRNKMPELNVRLNSKLLAKEEVHIIAVVEVIIKTGDEDTELCELQIKGYDMFYSNLSPKDGRGVVVYAKTELEASPVIFHEEFHESVWISIPMGSDGKDKMLIGCVYRSPNSSDVNNDNLLRLINDANNTPFSSILILGDFNFPHIDWELEQAYTGGSSVTSRFLETVKDNFLTQHVKAPTRGRCNQTPHILDLVFTRYEEEIQHLTSEAPLGLSDHSVLNIRIRCDKNITAHTTTKYLFDKGDYNSLITEFGKIDWNSLFAGDNLRDDVDKQWQLFKIKYLELVDKYIPKRTFSKTAQNPGDTRGKYCKDVKLAVKKKHRLWQRYMETKDGQKYKEYVQARNRSKALIRQTQRESCRRIALSIKANPKKFWSFVNNKTKVKSEIPHLIVNSSPDRSPELTASTEEKAEVLSSFFSSVFTTEPPGDFVGIKPRSIKQPMTDISFSEQLVEAKLSKLKISTSTGPDHMHSRVLKELGSVISLPLSLIFQTSFTTGTVPEDWKMANITAIHKKGDKRAADNYRPISLTSVVCKVMESIISDALVIHIKVNGLFSSKQFGFLKGRSTTLQLLNVLDEWTKLLDTGTTIDVVYTDFQKAFDSVPHRRLMSKLEAYGVHGHLLSWINSFLLGRKQRVVINGLESTWKAVFSGVPQGSVLGPILFLIYINDIVDNLSCTTYLFADDMKLFNGITQDADMARLQSDICAVDTWTDHWLLKLNAQKCKVMTVSKYNHHRSTGTSYHLPAGGTNHQLQMVSEEKDLGVVIDSNLQFDNHILGKVKTANRTLG